MKKAIKRWLEKLAKANKETFGNERLDCCNLNRNDNKAKMINNRLVNSQNK